MKSKADAEQEINLLNTEIDRLKLDKGNKNRFNEIEKCYADIEHLQEKAGKDITILSNYAYFLTVQNKYHDAIEKYTKELVRCRKLAESNPDLYLTELAEILNLDFTPKSKHS